MNRRLLNAALGLALLVGSRLAAEPPNADQPGAAQAPAATPEGLELFERRVRPVLVEHCQKCHGAKKQEAGLRLDSRANLLRGGDGGPVVVPGNVGASKLATAIGYGDENLQMPPDGKLPAEALAALNQWIELGLPWPAAPADAAAADPDAWKRHWAFQPLRDPPPPAVRQTAWVRAPIDAFILAKLESAGLTPAAPAERAVWLRRVSFDLLGLPPTADQIDAFARDTAPDAFERVVDRLLAAPAYGERWARHWLDYARYADTKGYVFMEDRKYPFAYKYRDWVVKALNDDMPYDEFLIRQIAADRLPTAGEPGALAALGFLTVGRRFLNNQADIIDDRLDVLCRTTMGLTVTCARCHDHKFDPISAKDYYALYGVFASTVEPKEPAEVMSMADAPQPHNVRVFIRGNPGNQGDEAPRRFLTCLAGPDAALFSQGSGRLELAQAIAGRDNPLTARVLVNRAWQQFFGAGLVRTPSDFGLRSDAPTHPELLDWLARHFIDDGWSLKKLHRAIVLSSTYRQSSDTSDAQRQRLADQRDPENRLLSRMNRRRLDLEAMRDALLSASGALDLTLGGPSVDLATEPFTHRRTIYGLVERQNLPGMFRTFDFAGPDTHSPQRFVTTVPQQALFLMNSRFVAEQARLLAAATQEPAAQSAQAQPRERIARLYLRALGRAPAADEAQLAQDYLAGEAARAPLAPVWRYGYGTWDRAADQLTGYTDLTHFSGTHWQFGPQYPDPKMSYVGLHATGGHPGVSQAVVRRWTAPAAGSVTIDGVAEHGNAQGDGVEAIARSSRHGVLGRWIVAHNRQDTHVENVAVERGDTIDFIVDPRANDNYDSFRWAPKLHLAPAAGAPAAAAGQALPTDHWNAETDFHGPLPPAMDSWTRLAQVLLLSNEFVFLD